MTSQMPSNMRSSIEAYLETFGNVYLPLGLKFLVELRGNEKMTEITKLIVQGF